jgi:hypothetical protein
MKWVPVSTSGLVILFLLLLDLFDVYSELGAYIFAVAAHDAVLLLALHHHRDLVTLLVPLIGFDQQVLGTELDAVVACLAPLLCL